MSALITRRRFVAGAAGLGLLAGCGRLPGQAPTPVRLPRLGYLGAGSSPTYAGALDALRLGLRELGYIEGETIRIEYRFTDGRLNQAPALVAELVSLEPDLIIVNGGGPAAAAKEAAAAIPIIGAPLGGDPVGAGLVASLAHPSGNVTGLSTLAKGTVAKRLQLLQEVVPSMYRVAILWNAENGSKMIEFQEAEAAAPALGLQVLSVEVRSANGFDDAFRAVAASGAHSLVVLAEPLTISNGARIAAFAVQRRLPSIYELREYTDAGGLMNYGTNLADLFRRTAAYVDKILKGTKPADLPIEQPMTFECVVNMKTARELGITFPPEIMLQVTEVING